MLGRRVQEATLGRFLDEVVKRITTEAAAAHPAAVTTCTILMYQEFFAGWMAPVFAYTFCDDLEQRWRQQAQASAHHAPGSASCMSATVGHPSLAATPRLMAAVGAEEGVQAVRPHYFSLQFCFLLVGTPLINA